MCFLITQRGMLAEHSPPARDLRAFCVFSQHPALVYFAGKPIENAVSCLNTLCEVIKHENDKKLGSQ